MIYWDKHALPKDMVFAQTSDYIVDTRKSQIIADSSIFFNKDFFNEPLVGQVVNKITSGKQAGNFPSFTSYAKDVEVREIFENIDYRGGYKLLGKKFVADGGKYRDASIVFRKDGQEVFIAKANRFIIGNDKITSEGVGIRIFFDEDSLYHSNLSFKYSNNNRLLQLYRERNSSSDSPMLNSYHQLTMDFELLRWNVDSDIITLGSLKGTTESVVSFESINRYLQSRFIEIQGIDRTHPLILIYNYVKEKDEETFYMEDFARYAKFPGHQIKSYLLRLASYGFIFYDFSEERVTVQPMLYTYINAASGIDDYDVISFFSRALDTDEGSKIKGHIVNAVMDISSKDLMIRGIYNVKLSDSSTVAIFPDRGMITVKKNRDFVFNGRIFAGRGRLNLFGKDFHFHYDDFKIDLNIIDSLELSVPWKNSRGEQELVSVNTIFEYVKDEVKPQGELRIDHPENKSGLRKDSFPEFPIFRSNQRSYVYYDRYYYAYNRDRFFFHLDPYEIDSLNSFKTQGLWFSGSFESAGIFPTFKDTLRIQADLSFGFKRETPTKGFPIYGGVGNFRDNIYLSNSGLRGGGSLVYKNFKASSDDMIWFPDSVNFNTDSLSISEINTGIEFPEVSNKETYVRFSPYKEEMNIYMREEAFSFYNDRSKFEGNLFMQANGLTGEGIMTLDKAEVESDLFYYNANWFGSDVAALRVFGKEDRYAILGNNLRAHIDLEMRKGIFNSNEYGSSFNLTSNNYICYIDRCVWDMDYENITFEQDISSLGDTLSLKNIGSEFISTHPQQDSLSFFAKKAEYNLKDYIIYANGVESIVVADAVIYPDSGIVRVEKDAKIQTLLNASIDLKGLSSHSFVNATIDIQSRISYTASGEYTFNYASDKKKKIFFHKIKVNAENVTQAYAELDDKEPFRINSKLDLKGGVELNANKKDLTFSGYFRLNHNCDLLDKEWVKFRSEVNPYDIDIILNDSLINDNNDKLYAGIIMRRDTIGLYTTFLNQKRNVFDLEVISSAYSLSFDTLEAAFIMHGKDSLDNTFKLFENTCKSIGEGDLELNMDLGRINVKTIGLIEHSIKEKETDIYGFLLIDFHFSEDAMEAMACDLTACKDNKGKIEPIAGFDEYDDLFFRNLRRLVQDKSYVDQVLQGLEISKRNAFPKELGHTLAFTKSHLKWDNKNKAFVSTRVALGNINLFPIDDEEINGSIVLQKRKGNSKDMLIIDVKTYENEDYFFKYDRGEMRAFSEYIDFANSVKEVSTSKRRLEGRPLYKYLFSSREWFEKERIKYKKKYY